MARVRHQDTKIFISWSGTRSKEIASSLKTWLIDVFGDLKPWTSVDDIAAGVRWPSAIEEGLELARVGIICLTPENQKSAWILFEAGALMRAVQTARVVPYLFEISKADLTFPLAQFQAVDADEAGTLEMLASINEARAAPASQDQLRRIFKTWWPALRDRLAAIPPPTVATSEPRSDRALLEEILEHARAGRSLDLSKIVSAANIVQKKEAVFLDTLSDDQLRNHLAYLQYEYDNSVDRNKRVYYEYVIEAVMRELRGRKLYPPATAE